MTFGYKERKEEDRQQFIATLKQIDINKVVYLDEAGIDDNEVHESVWSKIGPRFFGKKPGKKKVRYSLISGLLANKIIAPFVFIGSCIREIFEKYLEAVLLPTLAPKSIIIMDNATFHKGGNIEKLVKQFDCSIIYLPPYSPDLNPIEHFWFTIKNNARYLASTTKNAMEACIISAFEKMCGA